MATLEDCRQPRSKDVGASLNSTPQLLQMYIRTRQHDALTILDVVSNTVLFAEYVLILFTNPNRFVLLTHPYYIMELVVLLSFYAITIIDQTDAVIQISSNETAFKVFFCLCVFVYCFRIFRILRLLSITKGYAALYMTLRATKTDVIFFSAVFMTICMLSAFLVYFTELWSTGSFPNMFMSVWWSVVTLSSVGYGDKVPETDVGRVLTVFMIILSLLLVALPIVIITCYYGDYYTCVENVKKHQKQIEHSTINKRKITHSEG